MKFHFCLLTLRHMGDHMTLIKAPPTYTCIPWCPLHADQKVQSACLQKSSLPTFLLKRMARWQKENMWEYCTGVLQVVTRLIQPLLLNRQPHLPMAYHVSTDEALTPESQRDNCYISAGGNAGTHRVCPEALKVATLPLHCHSLG
jgi:hypothetical protein